MRNCKKFLSLSLAAAILFSTPVSYASELEAESLDVTIVNQQEAQEQTEEKTVEEQAEELLETILEETMQAEEVDELGEDTESGTTIQEEETSTINENGIEEENIAEENSKTNTEIQEIDGNEEQSDDEIEEGNENIDQIENVVAIEDNGENSVSDNSITENLNSENSVSENSISENTIVPEEKNRVKMKSVGKTGEVYSPMEYSWATKETPLINLAGDLDKLDGEKLGISEDKVQVTAYSKGLFSGVSEEINIAEDAALMVDGDKYNARSYNALTDASSKNSDHYYEKGTQVVPKSGEEGVWVRVDLGSQYPVEVINLKRGMYVDGEVNNTGHANGNDRGGRLQRYSETIILAGNNEDGSDAYVVHYDVPKSVSVDLPLGVTIPEAADRAENYYQETMGGAWFYMDQSSNGKDYTTIGTTKNAQYIWVYSDHPENGNGTVKDNFIMFTELAVYGYRSEERIQHYEKRRTIDNENPLFMAAAYGSDTHNLKSDDKVYLQGWNTISGRWDVIDEKVQPYSVLMMHLNNLGGQGMDHHAGQARVQDFYQNCLQQAYEADVSTALMLINASAVPNADGTAQGGANWNITRDVDYEWIDLMYRMYPNMEGIFNTENFWSGAFDQVAKATAKMLEIAHNHGGFFLWSEADHGGIFNGVFGNTEFKNAVKGEYGESMFFTTKTTNGGADALSTQSTLMGSWMAGYIGGWGMLSDTWAWGNSSPSYGDFGVTNHSSSISNSLWGTNGKPWETTLAVPETLLGMQILTTYLQGGTIYTFEFPEAVYGSMDQAAPAYAHVIEPLYKYIINNPGPSRKDMLDETKILYYGTPSSNVYSASVGPNTKMGLFSSGRYGGAPSVHTAWGNIEEVREQVNNVASKVGAQSPTVLNANDSNLTNTQYFNSIYPSEYLGVNEGDVEPAYAHNYDGKWFVYNNEINGEVEGDTAQKQGVVIPLEKEETARFKTILLPHTYMIINEKIEEGNISVTINNYRVDKGPILFDDIKRASDGQDGASNTYPFRWNGSSATGQGLSNAKRHLYKYSAYFNVVNANTKDDTAGNDLDYVVHKFTADKYVVDGIDFVNGADYVGEESNQERTKVGYSVVDGEIRVKQLSPNDHELRTTTFEIIGLAKKPRVEAIAYQQSDTDNIKQFDPTLGLTVDFEGNTATVTVTANGWVDLEISDLEYVKTNNPIEIEEKNLIDLAAGIGVDEISSTTEHKEGRITASHRPSIQSEAGARPLNKITNGDISAEDYTNPGDYSDESRGPVWVQIDLGSVQDVYSVDLYRYWQDGRQYANTVVMICPDDQFEEDDTLVLWNANGGNADRTPNVDDAWIGIGNGNKDAEGTHILPAGTDGLYKETQNGKTFEVDAENVKWLSGESEESLPANRGEESYRARYIRVYMNGHKGAGGNENHAGSHIVEVDVNGMVAKETENMAQSKKITSSHEPSTGNASMARPLSWIVDGNSTDLENYSDPGSNAGGEVWVEIDLEAICKVSDVELFRYWQGNRRYHNTVVMLSKNENFADEDTLVLWNANNTSAGKNGAVMEGVSEGKDTLYTETEKGKKFEVGAVSDQDFYEARYVRIYMNGHTRNDGSGNAVYNPNHIIEVKVNCIVE